MNENLQLLDTGKGVIEIHHTPQRKIDKALSYVNDCLADKVGFCFRNVQKIPLHTGKNIREHIDRLEQEILNPTVEGHTLWRLRELRAQLKMMEKFHYTFDEVARNRLRSNYDKLKRSLILLYDEGEIESYAISGFGMLNVSFWTEQETTETKWIEQGWTFKDTSFELRPGRAKGKGKELNCYPAHVNVKKSPTCLNNTGLRPTHNDISQHVTEGSGELNPEKLKERERGYTAARDANSAMYIRAGYTDKYGNWVKDIRNKIKGNIKVKA
jgi:hypothetical protein